MWLLFKNSLVGIKRRLIQFFGLVILILLAIAVFVGINQSNSALETSYNNLQLEGNAPHFYVLPPSNLSLVRNNKTNPLINRSCQKMDDESCISKLVTNTFAQQFNYHFNKPEKKTKLNSEFVTKKGYMRETYNLNVSGAAIHKSDKKLVYKLVRSWFGKENIDKTIVTDGKKPTTNNEVLIYKQFADRNNLKIGDMLPGTSFKITGFGIVPDFILPIINLTENIPDFSTQTLVFMTQSGYDKYTAEFDSADVNFENFYVAQFNNTKTWNSKSSQDYDKFASTFNNYIVSNTANPALQSYDQNLRSGGIKLQLLGNILLSMMFFVVIIIITILTIAFLIKREIDANRVSFGILKSLGYKAKELVLNLLGIVLVSTVIGSVIGYAVGIPIQHWASGIYTNYLQLRFSHADFNITYFLISLLVPLGFITLMTFIIGVFMLRLPALNLINKVPKMFSKMSQHLLMTIGSMPYFVRSRVAFFFRAWPRAVLVFCAMFFASILIVFIFICSSLVDKAVAETFNIMKYNYNYTYSPNLITASHSKSSGLHDQYQRSDLSYTFIPETKDHKKPANVTPISPSNLLEMVLTNHGENADDTLKNHYIPNSEFTKVTKFVRSNSVLINKLLLLINSNPTLAQKIADVANNLYHETIQASTIQKRALQLKNDIIPQLLALKQYTNGTADIDFGFVSYNPETELPYLVYQANMLGKGFPVHDSGDKFKQWYIQGIQGNINKFLTLNDRNTHKSLDNFITSGNKEWKNCNLNLPCSKKPIPIIINQITALSKSLKAGDTLNMSINTFEGNKQITINHAVKIVGIVDSFQLTYMFVPYQALRVVMNLPNNSYDAKFSIDKSLDLTKNFSLASSLNDYRLYSFAHIKPTISALYDIKAMRKAIMSYDLIAKSVIGILLVIAALIIAAILIIITNITLKDSERFIALYRVTGYTLREASSILLSVYLPFAAAGFLIGFPIGYSLVSLLILIVAKETGVAFPVSMQFWYYLAGIGLIFALYLGSYFAQLYQLKRRPLIDYFSAQS